MLNRMSWPKRIVTALFFILVASLILAIAYERFSRNRADSNYPPPGQFIAVEDHRLHVVAKGNGGPTVIFESGLGIDGHLSWYKVQDEVAKTAQTLSYDRAGVMWSERGDNPKTAEAMSAELESMLRAGGFPPPYILVGHSLAGLFSRPFIQNNKEDMAGVVFVDVSHPHQYDSTPEELQGGSPPALLVSALRATGILRYLITSGPLPTDDSGDIYATTVPHMIHRASGVRDESNRAESIARQAQAYEDFGDIPLVVITGASPTRNENMNASEETKEYMTTQWLKFQEDLLGLSTDSRHVLAMKSNHHVQISEPEIVIESILELVSRWRDKQESRGI